MWTQHLLSEEGQKEIAKVKELTKIAEEGEEDSGPHRRYRGLSQGLQTYNAA